MTVKGQVMTTAVRGVGNFFAFPQCTWYANKRYHDLHGIFVPWTTQSNANEWTARAHDFHWIVDSRPQKGDIFQLDANVQGAFGLGHVGVVENVNGNRFVGSSMNWGAHPTAVATVTYNTGAGVHFIRF